MVIFSSEDVCMSFQTFTSTLAVCTVTLLAACTIGDGSKQSGEESSAVSVETMSSSSASVSSVDIEVTSPVENTKVTSPLTVTGQARGMWYFEASFPVQLLDGNGQEIAVIPAQAQGDWMTAEMVPFIATLVFTHPSTSTGTLILKKDNPSGDPQYDAQIAIPIQF